MRTHLFRKILVALSAVGPGLFLIGYNIGTGSITAMAKSGAEYGMSLFWALVLSCIFTYVLMVAYGQLTIVSGKTALTNFRTSLKGGSPLAMIVMIALIAGELFALIGVMGIVGDLVREGIRLFAGGRIIHKGWILLFFVLILYALLWTGKYKSFEKVLIVFVILMVVCFVLVFFMVKPSFIAILKGLVPGIPQKQGAFGLVAAMAGTTCSAAVFIVRSTLVAEKGWTINDLKTEKKDSFISSFLMLFLSGLIMAVSAGTLNVMGLKLHNTVEMISLFEPIGGKLAALLLILGITGAGLSTAFPIVLIAPWLISDYTGRPRNIRSPMFRILILVGLIFSFGSLVLIQTAPVLMIFSQAFQACILPAVAIPVLILLNRATIMKENRASLIMNIGLVCVIIFSFVTTYFAIAELFN
jgi:Mn2+/Fe2+ NRAMP family transporter